MKVEDVSKLERLPRGFKLHEGDWIYLPRRKKWLIACCDCSLVHSVERKIVNGKFYVRLHRNDAETEALRKAIKRKKINGRRR